MPRTATTTGHRRNSTNSGVPVVLITGANRGVGLEFARQYACDGWHVIAGYRQLESINGLEGLAGKIEITRLDVRDAFSISTLAKKLEGLAVDTLINNAAVRGDVGGLQSLDPNSFLNVVAVNTLGPLMMTQAFLPHLLAGQRKVVVNVSSRVGSISDGLDSDGDYAYRCSKAALNIATAKLAFDFASHGVTFLALHPGWAQTDMGGEEAEVPVKTSVVGMKKLIDSAELKDSGTFRSFDGASIPW